MDIRYVTSADDIVASDLGGGFWEGWPHPPSPATHVRMLRESRHVVLALDPEAAAGRVVGFINAVSDGFHVAFIPYLEVVPAYRGRGIGGELVERMLAILQDFYAVDLTCDATLQPFYARFGLRPYSCMVRRNHARQATGAT
ncbi:MAG: GNAT family N-acetyltransferase [Phycisphaerales bacterium]|nr:GNAT family N-acetyltransferase [Phycisphaerales bacterium]